MAVGAVRLAIGGGVLFARGLARVPAATAVTLSLAEPLTAGTLGVLFLGERLTVPGLVGNGLLIAGLALISNRVHPSFGGKKSDVVLGRAQSARPNTTISSFSPPN